MEHVFALASLVLALGGDEGPLLPVEVPRIPPQGADGSDWRVQSISYDGLLAALGAPRDAQVADTAGSVSVMRRTPAGWVSEAFLTRPGAQAYELFGDAVGISGDLLVVGAPQVDGMYAGTGTAEVFVRAASGWQHRQTLVNSVTIRPNEEFGAAIAVAGTRIVVGAPRAGTFAEGRVFVFEPGPGGWVEVQSLGVSQDGYHEFGASIALDGERMLVGEPSRDVGSTLNVGRAYVFQRVAGVYALEAVLSSPQATQKTRQGESVDLFGELAILGAPHETGGGNAFLFSRETGSWQFVGQVFAGPPESEDDYGASVSVHDGVIAVGAPSRDFAGLGSGRAFLFRREAGAIRLSAEVSPQDHAQLGGLGGRLLLEGGELLVSAANVDAGGLSAGGVVCAFELEPAFQRYCFGDGNATTCPCGNGSPPGDERGCENSAGHGASAWGTGSISVAEDDLHVTGVGLPGGQPALLFAGTVAVNGGAGVVFGDGLLCAGGMVRRLGIRSAAPSGSVDFGPDLAARGGWSAGDTRYFQLWHRDPGGPCASGVNLSAALRIRFGY